MYLSTFIYMASFLDGVDAVAKLLAFFAAIGSMELYSESWRDVMFHTELQATRFMEKAMAQGYKGEFYVGFDDCLPEGIKEW